MPHVQPEATQQAQGVGQSDDLVVAILSDRAKALRPAALSAGMGADCADAARLWLLPVNTPDILLLDLPVKGVTDRRLSLLIRQLARACPDLVILLHDPAARHTGLPRDIEIEPASDTPTSLDAALNAAFAEARHLLQPRIGPQPLFFHRPPKRASLFR